MYWSEGVEGVWLAKPMCGLALSVPGDAADPAPLVLAVCHAA